MIDHGPNWQSLMIDGSSFGTFTETRDKGQTDRQTYGYRILILSSVSALFVVSHSHFTVCSSLHSSLSHPLISSASATSSNNNIPHRNNEPWQLSRGFELIFPALRGGGLLERARHVTQLLRLFSQVQSSLFAGWMAPWLFYSSVAENNDRVINDCCECCTF